VGSSKLTQCELLLSQCRVREYSPLQARWYPRRLRAIARLQKSVSPTCTVLATHDVVANGTQFDTCAAFKIPADAASRQEQTSA
jgi:hypothetical protein